MRRLRIRHTTTYEYSAPVQLQPHRLLVRPREGHDTHIESSRLEIHPRHEVTWHRDVHGNSVSVVAFCEPSARLSILSEVVIQHYEEAPLNFLVEERAVNFPFRYDPAEQIDLTPYLLPVFGESEPTLRDWVYRFWRPGQVLETYVLLDAINKAIAQGFAYQMREEPGVQPPVGTLARNSGSCRDFATLFIEACRYLGLASRFVSGYLHCPATEAGHGSTHAWSEIYLPGAGWKGFDSTSGQIVGSDHIAVAVSRHPETIPPVSGTFIGAAEPPPAMTVDVQVSQIR